MKEQGHYVSVMGTMGSGKTTAARLLAENLNFHLLEENFGQNAFLPLFYKDMQRWAFHSQTFFLLEKIDQVLKTRALLEKANVIQDTPIQQDAFSYAKAQHVLGNMDDNEWQLYQKMYDLSSPRFPIPDLIVYLEASMPVLVTRIKSRKRGYEQEIPRSYLELLDTLNHTWLNENTQVPVLTIETDGLNIVESREAQEQMVAAVKSRLNI